MIYITGDTHGSIDFSKIKHYFKSRYHSYKDYLIILGDAGIIWDKNIPINENYKYIDITIIFIDGNHENFDLLNEYPIVDFHGAKAHKIYSNIYHILRGEIININDLTFLCIGGAASIDKALRVEHVSYWKDEDITIDDYNNALNNLKKHNNKVDFVLTHCAPTSALKNMFCAFESDSSTTFLEKIKNQIDFSYWYFGHYHIDKTFDKFRCFYLDIKELQIMDCGSKKINYNFLSLDNDESFLRNWGTWRLTKLKENDLPEWYYKFYCYRWWFYNLKGIKDVAIKRSVFSNHINKDTILYFSYDKVLPKDDNYQPINEDDWDVKTWRVFLEDIIMAIEKYNPTLVLDGIKEQINLVYDFYNNDCVSYSVVRPYPHIKTRILTEPFSDDKAICFVEEGGIVLSQFFSIELAKSYIETQTKKYNNVTFEINEDLANNQIVYKAIDNTKEFIIKKY